MEVYFSAVALHVILTTSVVASCEEKTWESARQSDNELAPAPVLASALRDPEVVRFLGVSSFGPLTLFFWI